MKNIILVILLMLGLGSQINAAENTFSSSDALSQTLQDILKLNNDQANETVKLIKNYLINSENEPTAANIAKLVSTTKSKFKSFKENIVELIEKLLGLNKDKRKAEDEPLTNAIDSLLNSQEIQAARKTIKENVAKADNLATEARESLKNNKFSEFIEKMNQAETLMPASRKQAFRTSRRKLIYDKLTALLDTYQANRLNVNKAKDFLDAWLNLVAKPGEEGTFNSLASRFEWEISSIIHIGGEGLVEFGTYKDFHNFVKGLKDFVDEVKVRSSLFNQMSSYIGTSEGRFDHPSKTSGWIQFDKKNRWRGQHTNDDTNDLHDSVW